MVLGDVPPSEKLKIGRKRYEEDCMRIESNNALLSDGFKWAVQKAKTFVVSYTEKYSLQGTTQGRYLTGGVPPVRFSM